MPRFLKAIVPASAMVLEERAWNAFPYCKTILTNKFMGERFSLTIESMHREDTGATENSLDLPAEIIKRRHVVTLDIANDECTDRTPEDALYDPKNYPKFDRIGPLRPNWKVLQSSTSTLQELAKSTMMCCYKMITLKFKIFGLESRADSIIDKVCLQCS